MPPNSLSPSAISATFVIALVTGHWADAGDLTENATAVAGIIRPGYAPRRWRDLW